MVSCAPQSRAEHLIAAGRAALPAFSLVAIWLDPRHAALPSARLGPLTLGERVAALEGTLAIVSSPAGARLEISRRRAGA